MPSRLRCPVRHLGDDAQQVLHARLRLPRAPAGTRSGPCQFLGDLVEEAFGREGVVAVADAAPGRKPRAARLTTCSASLFGIGYCGIGEPFITIRSTGGGLPPAMRRRVGDRPIRRRCDGARRSACRWRRSPASMWCAVIGRNLPKVDVVLAAPDQLDRLADRLGRAAPRRCTTSCCAAAAETAAEHMLVQRDLRPARSAAGRATWLSRSVGALRAGPDFRRLAVGG